MTPDKIEFDLTYMYIQGRPTDRPSLFTHPSKTTITSPDPPIHPSCSPTVSSSILQSETIIHVQTDDDDDDDDNTPPHPHLKNEFEAEQSKPDILTSLHPSLSPKIASCI